MRRIIFYLVIIFISTIAFSQDSTIYFQNCKTVLRGKYENARMMGLWSGYDSITKKAVEVKMVNYVKNEYIIKFIDTINLMNESVEAVLFKGDLFWHGKWQSFNEKSKYRVETNYSLGKRIGLTLYYQGNILYKVSWDNDTLELQRTTLFFNGKDNGLFTYSQEDIQNKLHGLSIQFYENGEIKEFGHYIKGAKTGEWSYYYENGQLSSRGKYYDDYILLGNIMHPNKLVNKDNIPIEQIYPKVKYDFSKVDMSPHYYYLKTGKWEYFDEIGNLIRVEYYHKGVLKKVVLSKR